MFWQMPSGQTFQMRLIFFILFNFFFFKFKYLQYHVLAGVLWSNLSSVSNIFKFHVLLQFFKFKYLGHLGL